MFFVAVEFAPHSNASKKHFFPQNFWYRVLAVKFILKEELFGI
jgi:hypothetical protein